MDTVSHGLLNEVSHSSRHRRSQSLRTLTYVATLAVAAYSVYRWYTQAEEEEDCNVTSAGAAADGDKGWSVENAQSVSRPPSFVEDVPRPAYARQGSFQVTDESGQQHGAINDVRASQWSWLVDKEKPKEAKASSFKKRGMGVNGSSRRSRDEDSSSADELGGGTAPAPGRKKGVKFKLDERANFYGFGVTHASSNR